MIRMFAGSRAARLLAGIILLIVVLLLIVAFNMYDRYQRYQAEIDSMQPRIAQLQGLLMAHENIKASAEEAGLELSEYTYPAGQDEAALNSDLQKTARSIFADAGMHVTGSQILSSKPTETLTQLMLDLNVSGSFESFEAALQGLKNVRPRILVDHLRIEPVPRLRGEKTQGLTVNARLFVYKEGG